MTRMQHSVDIARTPEEVLTYAASAARWPEWHPSSLKIYGSDGPQACGMRFEEDIEAGGRKGHLRWEVLDYVPGKRWHARALGDNHGLDMTVTYDCSPTAGGGTRFVRTLDYSLSGALIQLANVLVLKRRIERESAFSLQQLRDRAEKL